MGIAYAGTDANLCLLSIWRSTLILSFASCYLMWGTYTLADVEESGKRDYGLICTIAITFLAQWHPLIVPRRGDLTNHSIHDN